MCHTVHGRQVLLLCQSVLHLRQSHTLPKGADVTWDVWKAGFNSLLIRQDLS